MKTSTSNEGGAGRGLGPRPPEPFKESRQRPPGSDRRRRRRRRRGRVVPRSGSSRSLRRCRSVVLLVGQLRALGCPSRHPPTPPPPLTPEGAGQPPPGLHVCAVSPALVSGCFTRGGDGDGEALTPAGCLLWPWEA